MIIIFIIKQVGYDVKGMKRRDGEGGRGGISECGITLHNKTAKMEIIKMHKCSCSRYLHVGHTPWI